MLTGITIIGDFLRSDEKGRPGDSDQCVMWLFNAIKRQLVRAAALPVHPVTAQNFADLYRWVEASRPPEQADRYWAATFDELPNDDALNHILQHRLERQFVVGYELPPYLRRWLGRFGIPFVDLRIHPVRFLDDLLFAVRASDPETQSRLMGMGVPEHNVHAAAGLIEAMCCLNTSCNLPRETLLVIGQRVMDSSQVIGGSFFDALAHQDEIAQICGAYPAVLLKPHPYGGQHSLLLATAAAPNAAGVTSDNLYRLFAQPQIAAVLTVSSSAAYEAGYFGKQLHTLAALPIRIGWRGDECDAETYASVDGQVLSSDFWRVILAPHTKVSAHDGARLPDKPNRLRIALNSFWNFQEIDTDRIPAGPHGVRPGLLA